MAYLRLQSLLVQGLRVGWSSFVCLCALLTVTASLPRTVHADPPADKAGKPAGDDKNKKETPPAEDSEVKLGRENAEENDKQVKLIKDPALVDRVNRIGQEIAEVANKTPITAHWGSSQLKQFKYSFKVVDDKDVNAYSLPGGFIYVNKGLLDYVRSDDELAGVLAHEITHASHHHMVKLIKEQRKIQNVLLPLIAASLVLGRNSGSSAQTLMVAGNLYTVAKINSYGIEAEKDADHGGMILLTHTHYNPVGLYSFMLRLAADERTHPQIDMGIYRTHPPSDERAEAAKALLDELHIPARLSDVDPTLLASVRTAKDPVNGNETAEIRLRGVTLCRMVAADGLTAGERAQRAAKRLNSVLDMRLQPFEVRLNREQTQIVVRGIPFLTEADATAQNKSLSALAREMSDAVTQISQKQQLETAY